MKHLTLIIFVFSWGLLAPTVSAQDTLVTLSLEKAIQIGFQNNHLLLNAELERKKSEFQLKEAQSKLLPQLEGYSKFLYSYSIPQVAIPGEIIGQSGPTLVEFGTKYDWSTGITASQIIYNKSYFTSLKAAREAIHLNQLNLKQQKEEIAYQISQIYYLCQISLQQKKQLEGSLENMNKLLDITALQSEYEMIREVDHQRVMVDKNNLLAQIDQMDQLIKEQKGLLKYLLNIEQEAPVQLTDSVLIEKNSLLSATAEPNFKNRTVLRMLEKQMEMNQLNLKSARQAYLPSIAAFAQHYYQGMRNEFDFFEGGDDKFFEAGIFGLNLTMPIFDGFEKRSRISQHKIAQAQLENTRKNTLNLLEKEHLDALRQLDYNYQAYLRQQENTWIDENNYEVNLNGYKEQVVSLTDLLLAESSLTQSRMAAYNALLQLKQAELNLKKIKGELINQYPLK